MFELSECAVEYTNGLNRLANLAAYVDKGMLPNPGTVLDQPAWFMAWCAQLQHESNKIELERIKKR